MPSERLFSQAENIYDDLRSRLLGEKVGQLLLIRSNLAFVGYDYWGQFPQNLTQMLLRRGYNPKYLVVIVVFRHYIPIRSSISLPNIVILYGTYIWLCDAYYTRLFSKVKFSQFSIKIIMKLLKIVKWVIHCNHTGKNIQISYNSQLLVI